MCMVVSAPLNLYSTLPQILWHIHDPYDEYYNMVYILYAYHMDRFLGICLNIGPGDQF